MTSARALLALVCGVAAAPALAVQLGGSVGGSYGTSEQSGARGSVSGGTWAWNGGLSVGSLPLNPRLAVVSGSVRYNGLRQEADGMRSSGDGLTFGLNSTLFGASRSPLQLSASRSTSDFTSEGDQAQIGTSRTLTLSGVSLYRLRAGPLLIASLRRVEVETATGLAFDSRATNHLGLRARHSVQNLKYAANYETSWNGGDRADANYRQHALEFEGSAAITKSLQVFFRDDYHVRLPTEQDARNPRFETHALATGTESLRSGKVTQGVSYRYNRSLGGLAGDELERIQHGVAYRVGYRPGNAWGYHGSLNGNYGVQRFDGDEDRGSGAHASGGASWTRQLSGESSVNANAEGSTGLLVHRDSSDAAYGASGSVALAQQWWKWSSSLAYGASWAQNLSGLEQTSFQHKLSGSARRRFRRTMVSANLGAASSRRDTPLAGAAFARSLTAGAGLTWWRISLDGSLSLSDSVGGVDGGLGDGLLLAPTYVAHSSSAIARAGFRLTKRTHLNGLARQSWIDSPGEPQRSELGLQGELRYSLHLVSLSAEARHTYTTHGPDWRRGNSFFVQVVRSFGLSL